MVLDLKEYQSKAIEFLDENDRAFLFMSCGTGKTLTTLMAVKKYEKVLILAPPTIVNRKVWEEEATKFGIEINFTTRSLYAKTILDEEFDVLVVDECHRIKGWKTQVSKRVEEYAKKIPRVIGLTGTWVCNGYWDIFCMSKALQIPMFKERTLKQFQHSYYIMEPIPNIRFAERAVALKENTDLFERVELKSFLFKHEFSDYEENVVYVEGDLTKEYKSCMNNVLDTLILTPLSKLIYLRQLANGFFYNEDGKTIDVDEFKIAKFYEVYEQLKKEGHKVIVVYKFTHDRDRIQVTEEDTIMSEQSAEGLNLQDNSAIIFLSPTFSFSNYEQARKRILRLGQEKHCKVITLCRRKTIDESMLRNRDSKLNASQLLEEFIKWKN